MKRETYEKHNKIIDALLRLDIHFINSIIMDGIYDDYFYEQHMDTKTRSAVSIANVIVDTINPCSVFDIGCGNGIFISELNKRGIDVLGCDSSKAAIRTSCKNVTIFAADVTNPIMLNRKYDLVMCVEVAEHIHKKYSDQLIANCINNGERILFTSAPPGQGGIGHINEQPYEFWITKFNKFGFVHDEKMTLCLKEKMRSKKVIWWITENIMYLRKS